MAKYYDKNRPEEETGEQLFHTRVKRGRNRKPSWKEVERWRERWTPDLVRTVIKTLKANESLDTIKELDFIEDIVDGSRKRSPDLRGFNITIVKEFVEEKKPIIKNYDFTSFHFEGSVLTGIQFRNCNFYKAYLEKSTLRNVKFTDCSLIKTHVEDADLRECDLTEANLAFIWYTEDSWLVPGTIFRMTILQNAINVDPMLERYIKDQSFLYVFRYKSSLNKHIYSLWWLTSNCGRSFSLWAGWSLLICLIFGFLFLPAPVFLGERWSEFWNQYGPSLYLNPHTPKAWFTYFYYSIVTFTTLGFGDVTPQNLLGEILVTVEVIIGYLMLGGLLSLLANKMARRS